MADVDFDDLAGYEPAAAKGGGRAQRLINIAGAASSVLLVIGLAVWGYKIAVRDVNGVPVMRAVGGPMRIAPEDPGGTIAENQGLAVNAVAAEGGASQPSDRLVLAPRSATLDEGDAAGLSELSGPELSGPEMQPPATAASDTPDALSSRPQPSAMAAAPSPGADTAVPASAAPAHPPVDPVAVENALVDAIAADAAPLSPDLPKGAMVKSLRPPERPAHAARVPLAAAVAAAEADAVTDVQPTAAGAPAHAPAPAEIDPAKVKAGARLVQLGAYDSPDQARGEWKKMQARFPDLLAAKSLVVQSAESGGRTFYRLRAHGFDGEDDARRFCTALLAEGAACIPVVQR